MKKNKNLKLELDAEEADILSSFERGEWQPVKNLKKEKLRAQKAAAETLKKDVRINIRLTNHDVSTIKQIAAYEGLPYQTLIASVLHKFAAGHLENRLYVT